jgi:epsilon-lactone hydrolase
VIPRHVPARVVAPGLAGFYRLALHPKVPTKISRRLLEAVARSAALPRDTTVGFSILGGRPVERITVGASERPRAVLYLHGGGYTVGSAATHRAAAAFLARETGAVVYSLDYRLAPEHPYPAALEDAVAAFVELAAGSDPARIAISGDSAGGGLALAAARVLIDEHSLRPGALALFSPFTDAADLDFSADRDLVINLAWGRRSSAAYSAGADLRTPGISPVFGDLSGMPPMWIITGTQELLYRQILRFVSVARAAGADITLVEHPMLWHSGHTQAGLVREATEVVQDAGAYLRGKLDAPVRAAKVSAARIAAAEAAAAEG